MKRSLLVAVFSVWVVCGAVGVGVDSMVVFKTNDTCYLGIYGVHTVCPGSIADSSKDITTDSIKISLCYYAGNSSGDFCSVSDTIYLGVLNNPIYTITIRVAISPLFGSNNCNTTNWKDTFTLVYLSTAIDEASENRFSLSPNPATTYLTIQTEQLTAPASFQLFDITGRMVLQQPLTATTNRVELNGVSKGMYLYSVVSEKEKAGAGKLVVE